MPKALWFILEFALFPIFFFLYIFHSNLHLVELIFLLIINNELMLLILYFSITYAFNFLLIEQIITIAISTFIKNRWKAYTVSFTKWMIIKILWKILNILIIRFNTIGDEIKLRRLWKWKLFRFKVPLKKMREIFYKSST